MQTAAMLQLEAGVRKSTDKQMKKIWKSWDYKKLSRGPRTQEVISKTGRDYVATAG